ncbi:MAG: aminotransferase class V-fold PLP-dependent enzyme [Rhodopirellula sp.]|nr:aminotransferase class V-fold PLP-dependent enzyme [Rhodopirellula sp.]
MASTLYLDTARLGRMCPEAQAADRDFACLASEEGCTLYFEQFLRWGYTALPHSLGRRYPGLSFWAGVTAFKNDLKTVLCLPRKRHLLVANRSAQLVRLAARVLCSRCENVMVTDMEWPAYMNALTVECQRKGRLLTTVPIREAILRDRIEQVEVIDRLLGYYRRHDCDGLFLSAVTFQGVQLPVRQLVQTLGDRDKPRFVVLDAAQALNHIPLGLGEEYCDLVLAGCHKWLRAYQTLGLAFCCRRPAERLIAEAYTDMRKRGELDDPLLAFTNQLETETTDCYSETVNLAPMFTAAAAVRRMLGSSRAKRDELLAQMANADRLVDMASQAGWQPTRPALPMQSGILLLDPRRQDTRIAPANVIRERFLAFGVALTVYDGGTVRASLPDRAFGGAELDLLQTAFCRCA